MNQRACRVIIRDEIFCGKMSSFCSKTIMDSSGRSLAESKTKMGQTFDHLYIDGFEQRLTIPYDYLDPYYQSIKMWKVNTTMSEKPLSIRGGATASSSLAIIIFLSWEIGSRLTGHLEYSILSHLFSIPFWMTIAPFTSIALKMSPMVTVLKIIRNKSVMGLPMLPYTSMANLTFVLVAYGMLVNDLKLIIAHGVGHILSVFYCAQYIRYVTPGANDLPGTVNQHKVTSLSIVSLVLASFALLKREISREIVGWSSVILSCLMYVGPLSRLRKAIKEKSSKEMPLPFALVGYANALAWVVYGIVKKDPILYLPCILGLASSSTQIIINVLWR